MLEPWELERANNVAEYAMKCSFLQLACIPPHFLESMHKRDIERLYQIEAEEEE